MQDPRIVKLADVLVNYSVEVKRGNLVRIVGSTVAEPLMVEVYKAVVTAGGHPYVTLTPDECSEQFFKLAQKHQLDFVNPIAKYEMSTIDCMISAWGGTNTKHLSNVNPGKQARASAARSPIVSIFMRRSAIPKGRKDRLRWVGAQYPCQAHAQDAEMSLSDFEDFVFDACLLNRPNPAGEWKKISERQQRVCDYLNKAKEIRFRNGEGTDLRVGVAGRRWINCDGKANFPDGEVFTGPIENATEGIVHYNFPAVYGGREVHDIRLRFKSGRVVDCSASKNEDFLIKMLDQDRGARILGEVAIGTNYRIQRYMKNTLFDEKIGGTFHAALGASITESGGKNKSGLHWDMVCDLRDGGTIEADGKVISRNGRFTKANWPQPA
ncbi:MAG: aminopeptidase [Planctomycetota bacterium]|nr:aminopeptidase [Planctomycetota bacterium]